jgi:CRP/FNR family cyclic AMP-dependent transcriptional regulator
VSVDLLTKRASFIRANEVLRRLRPEDAEKLARSSDVVRLPRRSAVWMPGQTDERVYLVRSGVVKVHQTLDGGRELTLGFYAKGDLLGEEALLVGGPRTTRADAYLPSELYALPVAELRTYEDQLGSGLARMVSSRRARMERRLGVLLFKNAHARLASLLLELADEFGVRDSRGTIVNLKLTHKELAGLIGATRETVSFAIVDLRREGMVLTEGKRVVLLEPARLRALVGA